MPKHFHLLKTSDLFWVNITKNTTTEIDYLKKNFRFNDLDLIECLPPIQRPKLVDRGNHFFMILLFPIYNRVTREIFSAEVDFFIGRDYLVTVHDNSLPPLQNFYRLCEKNPKIKAEYFETDPADLLYEILNQLLNYCFPLLMHINNDVDNLEKKIFEGNSTGLIKEVSIIKRNIVNFRKAMQAHRAVINKLTHGVGKLFPSTQLEIYFQYLVEQTEEIWQLLENHKDTINALHETQNSLGTYRLNKAIRFLTIISVIFMPLNLMAFLASTRFASLPLIEHPYGFWIMLAAMGIVTLISIWIFKRKKWL